MVNFRRDEQERRIGEYINKLEENVKDNLVNNQNLIKHVGNMDENKEADIKTAVSQAVENAANNVITWIRRVIWFFMNNSADGVFV
jgi:hypothetical protein